MKGVLIVGNWKMHGTPKEWLALFSSIAKGLSGMLESKLEVSSKSRQARVVVCPPFPALGVLSQCDFLELKPEGVLLGAQNVHTENMGPFTGEVSAPMLRSLGCSYVILGHSERRQMLHETDAFIAKKVHASITEGLKPIVCVGEPEGTADIKSFLETQLENSLKGITTQQAAALTIAYEPIWAIGSGRAATEQDITKAMVILQNKLSGMYPGVGASIPLLYGGSMTAKNAAEILAIPGVSGGLIGGASLKADTFLEIVKAAH